MRILGIDPGLSITGYGLIEPAGTSPRLIGAGTLRNRAGLPLEKRLHELHRGASEVIKEGKPDMVAVEALFSNYRHPTAAIQMGHARGVLFLAAAEAGLPVFSYEPARVKKSLTGSGRATKRQMQNMVQSVFSLDAPPDPPDVADAIAVALCHANALRQGDLKRGRGPRELPEAIRKVLDSSRDTTKPSFDSIVERLIRKE
jgi:crossover junction endodeoxyribonuclease RuvC